MLFLLLQAIQIKSAVAVEGLKGYVYVEAYKQTHLKNVSILSPTGNYPFNLGISFF